MRHNRSQRGSTRSHHALSATAITKCQNCNQPVKRHIACANCGQYRGKIVLNFEKKTKAKTEVKK